MCSDVVTSINVELSESTIAYAYAKSLELGIDVGDYIDMCVMFTNSLPSSLLFTLMSGEPVRIEASAIEGVENE